MDASQSGQRSRNSPIIDRWSVICVEWHERKGNFHLWKIFLAFIEWKSDLNNSEDIQNFIGSIYDNEEIQLELVALFFDLI